MTTYPATISDLTKAFVVITNDDIKAPEHLKVMHLLPHQCSGSTKIDTKGVLTYRTTSSSGLWYFAANK